ncbi:hypothetical protein [Aliiroseovarius sp. 2305UL8-7]|uniref:hypothetical protein n=1 Tax=Aliiroseovarius conchicola TaxID=3121637 RepID=UPI00352738A3
MRILVGSMALASLAACAAPLPDSRSPSAALQTQQTASGAPLSAMIEGSSVTSQPLDGAQPVQTTGGISDEQDFGAVSARESIESDAARLQNYQTAYVQAEAVAVPERPGGNSASVVQYALSTNNVVGQSIYSRSSLSGASRAERNCAKYTSADFAQIAFLEAGGPKRDKMGLDPDGDGFACGWNPAPFRNARAGVAQAAVVEDTGVSAADLEALGIGTEQTPAVSDPVPLPGDTLNISPE